MSVRDLTILGCSSQQPTRHRNHSGYLLRWNEDGLLFDPGEGTQRQFIFAGVSPTCVNHIFISHFHGDHCFGFPSMLLRLNLDKVQHPIHCYYPASGKRYFDRLRHSTIYHETIQVIEHPVESNGLVFETDKFQIEAAFLEHGVDNVGWRITEKDTLKFHKDKLKNLGIKGPIVKDLIKNGEIEIEGKTIKLSDVSWTRKGESIAVVIDTRPCQNAFTLAKDTRLLLSESTYLKSEEKLAHQYYHMTAEQAGLLAKKAGAEELVLTHFSARYNESEAFEEEAKTVFPNSHAAEDFKVFNIPRLNNKNESATL